MDTTGAYEVAAAVLVLVELSFIAFVKRSHARQKSVEDLAVLVVGGLPAIYVTSARLFGNRDVQVLGGWVLLAAFVFGGLFALVFRAKYPRRESPE